MMSPKILLPRLLGFAISSSLCLYATSVFAAEIPTGIKLAKTQEITRGNRAEPETLDPQKAQGTPAGTVLADLFEGLVTVGLNGDIKPGIASSWKNQGNKKFTFHLRPAKWSDGRKVTAEDFVYAWRRAVNPKTASPYGWYVEETHIKNASAILKGKKPVKSLGVKALNDSTLQVTLDQPVPYFLSMLSHTTMYPTPKWVIKKYGSDWIKPGHMVSNGAYQLKDWIVNEKIVLTRNPNYWNNTKTVINQVTYLPLTDNNSELNRYYSGKNALDMTFSIPPNYYKKLSKELGSEVHSSQTIGNSYLSFNMKRKPFDNVLVRRALSFAIDRQALTQKVIAQGQQAAYNFTPPVTNGFNPPLKLAWSSWDQKKRMAMAKKLLKEAGYGPSHPLELTLLTDTRDENKRIAIAIQAMWTKLGIVGKKKESYVVVNIDPQEWKTYLQNLGQGNFDVARNGWYGDYNEPSTFLSLNLCDNPQNNSFNCNKIYDKEYAKSAAITDVKKRAKVYHALEKMLYDKMPLAPLYFNNTVRLIKPYVGGYTDNPLDRNYSRNLYIIQH